MSQDQDEDEHSVEMQLPYIAKIFFDRYINMLIRNIKIIPIVVGSLNFEREKNFALHLQKYFDDPRTLFVISSDFCHWLLSLLILGGVDLDINTIMI